MTQRFQMVNRDTGRIIFQADALGWRQFKMVYVQWAQTTPQGILPSQLQEIVAVDRLGFDDSALRLIGRALENLDTPAARILARRITDHFKTMRTNP